jgi:hypothetical protein
MRHPLADHVRALARIATILLATFPAALLAPASAQTPASTRITTASAVRLRAEPSTSAEIVETLGLGVALEVSRQSDAPEQVGGAESVWYLVKAPSGVEGWVFGALTGELDRAKPEETYLRIARERIARDELSFAEWADVVAFVDRVSSSVRSRDARGELGLARFRALGRSFFAIRDFEDARRPPYAAWLEKHKKEIVYSEPGGVWLVASDAIWALHDEYKGSAIAERIAWAAAENPLPGECEGDATCAFRYHVLTTARYLDLYPTGAHAKEAVTSIGETVDAILSDMKGEGHAFDVPTDAEYKRDLLAAIAELRAPVARLQDPAARRVVAWLDEMRGLMK